MTTSKMTTLKCAFALSLLFASRGSWAKLHTDSPFPLSHCYHWLETTKGYLQYKYDFAKNNQGELTFYTTPATSNGAVGGPGLYCAHAPISSTSYGDRVIRIDFVQDVVVLNETTGKKICGHNGNYYTNDQDCQNKNWDVKYYSSSNHWFVIQNPGAIASWSAVSPELAQDLQANAPLGDSSFQKKVPFVIQAMNNEVATQRTPPRIFNARARMGFADIIRQPSRLLEIPPLQVLTSLKDVDRNRIANDAFRWAQNTSVIRLSKDPEVPWSDIKPLIEKDTELRALFNRHLRSSFPKSAAAYKNIEVAVMLADLSTDDFPEEILASIFETYILRDVQVSGKPLPQLNPKMQSLLEKLIPQWIGTNSAKFRPFQLRVSRLAAQQKLPSGLQGSVTEWIQKTLPSLEKSWIQLATAGKTLGLGATPEEFKASCSSQLALHQLYRGEVEITVGQEFTLPLGRVTDSKEEEACNRWTSLIIRLAELRAKGVEKVHIVRGNIHGARRVPFELVVPNIDELGPVALDFVTKNVVQDMDRVEVGVNGASMRFEYNTTGYFTVAEVAAIIERLAKRSGVGTRARGEYEKQLGQKKYRIEARIQNQPVKIGIDELSEFKNECLGLKNFYDLPLNQVEQIKFSVSKTGQPKPLADEDIFNDEAFWNGLPEICEVMSRFLPRAIPAPKAAAAFERMNQAQHGFTVMLFHPTKGATRIPFPVNSTEEAAGICKELVEESAPSEGTELKIRLRSGQELKGSLGKNRSRASFCAAIMTTIDGQVPSSEQTKILARNSKAKISVKAGEVVREYRVDSGAELQAQCQSMPLALGDVDAVHYTYSSTTKPTATKRVIYPRKASYGSMSEFCQAIGADIQRMIEPL